MDVPCRRAGLGLAARRAMASAAPDDLDQRPLIQAPAPWPNWFATNRPRGVDVQWLPQNRPEAVFDAQWFRQEPPSRWFFHVRATEACGFLQERCVDWTGSCTVRGRDRFPDEPTYCLPASVPAGGEDALTASTVPRPTDPSGEFHPFSSIPWIGFYWLLWMLVMQAFTWPARSWLAFDGRRIVLLTAIAAWFTWVSFFDDRLEHSGWDKRRPGSSWEVLAGCRIPSRRLDRGRRLGRLLIPRADMAEGRPPLWPVSGWLAGAGRVGSFFPAQVADARLGTGQAPASAFDADADLSPGVFPASKRLKPAIRHPDRGQACPHRSNGECPPHPAPVAAIDQHGRRGLFSMTLLAAAHVAPVGPKQEGVRGCALPPGRSGR